MLLQKQNDRQRNGEEKKNGGSEKEGDKRHGFCLSDHVDILVEVLRRLDVRSLCAAACVCRLWSALARSDSIWEHLCFGRHVLSPPPPSSASLRRVVSALGGYRRLYMVGVLPVTSCLVRFGGDGLWTGDQVAQLALSLVSVDHYERLYLGAGIGDATSTTPATVFLCQPVNVA